MSPPRVGPPHTVPSGPCRAVAFAALPHTPASFPCWKGGVGTSIPTAMAAENPALWGCQGKKNPSNKKLGGGGGSDFPAFLAQPRLLRLSGSPNKWGPISPSPSLGFFFFLFTLWQQLPHADASVSGDPAEPCKCCRKRAGMYFPAPLGRALSEQGCFPGPQKPPLQPRAPPELGWGESGTQVGAFSPSGGKFSPNCSPGAISQ